MSTLKTNNIQHVDRSDPSIIINTDGSVNIAGTMTYEDVTNVDAVGIITGRNNIDAQKQVLVGTGVSVKAGGINVTAGVSTFAADVSIADKIIHTGDTNTAIRFPAADTISLETGGNEAFRVNSEGKLLIGQTNDNDGQICMAGVLQFNSGGSGTAGGANVRPNISRIADGGLLLAAGKDTDSTIRFDVAANASTNAAEVMRISPNGNIGINNSSPSYKLTVNGDTGINVTASSNSTEGVLSIMGRNSGGSVSAISRFKSYPDGSSNQSHLAIETRHNSNGLTEAIRITSAQSVGINTTSPNRRFTLYQDATTRMNLKSLANSTVGIEFGDPDDENIGYIVYDNTDDSMAFGTNTSQRIRIDSSGRVGLQGSPTKGVLDVRASGGSATMLTAVFGANEGQTAGALSDNTDKGARVGLYHYDTDEEPYSLFSSGASNGSNAINFGGGTGLMNAATNLGFYTAANSTTTNGTKRMDISSSGDITINTGNIVIGTDGKGIDFSATGNGGTGTPSELFDDYEEGSWNVTSLNYDYDGNQAQRGRYIKIGRMVYAFYRVKFHNQSTHTGNHLRWTGLPFTAQSGGTDDIGVAAHAHEYSTIDFFRVYVQPGSTYAYWYTSTGSNFNNSTSLNNADVRGCIIYRASY